MIITYIFFIIGFAILLAGAKILIDGSSALGVRLGMSQMLIGLTVVAIGTSLPELIINVFASINGNTDLAMGNVLGSNIINSLLIIGVAAIIYPLCMAGKDSARDVWISLFVTLGLLALANFSFFRENQLEISRIDAIIMLAVLGGYLFLLFRNSVKTETSPDETEIKPMGLFRSVAYILIGIGGLFFGGKWIVEGAGQIASDLNLSESVIGLTIVAAATSLPELVTSILAARNKNTDMAVGNAIGSNLFNILFVLGVSALITPIPFDTALNADLAILVGATILVLIFIKLDIGTTNKAISRLEGAFLILAYAAYLFWSVAG